MPAPMTMPTTIAIASRRRSSGRGTPSSLVSAIAGASAALALDARCRALEAQPSVECVAAHRGAHAAHHPVRIDEGEAEHVAVHVWPEQLLNPAPDRHRAPDAL